MPPVMAYLPCHLLPWSSSAHSHRRLSTTATTSLPPLWFHNPCYYATTREAIAAEENNRSTLPLGYAVLKHSIVLRVLPAARHLARLIYLRRAKLLIVCVLSCDEERL